MFNFSTVEGAQCYVCSWSPSDTYRADLCTRGNFSDSVRTTKCEHGCESVTVFDKNGKMDFFYRNCVQEAAVAVKGTQANHHHHQQSRSCWNETSKTISKEICMCYSDYCNGASLSTSDKFVMVSAMLAAYIALSHSSMEFF